MITADELKERLNVINSFWKIMVKFARYTGTDNECEELSTDVENLCKELGNSAFAKEIAVAFVNEIDRIMTKNGKDIKNGKSN